MISAVMFSVSLASGYFLRRGDQHLFGQFDPRTAGEVAMGGDGAHLSVSLSCSTLLSQRRTTARSTHRSGNRLGS